MKVKACSTPWCAKHWKKPPGILCPSFSSASTAGRIPRRGVTYLRFAFAGHVTDHDPAHALDDGVVRALWLTPQEIAREAARHRSPQVQRTLDDYLAGRRYPLDLLNEVV